MTRMILGMVLVAAIVAAPVWAASAVAPAKAPAPAPAAPDKAADKAKAEPKAAESPAAQKGWLGIRMGTLPEAVAVHLGLAKDAGVIVRNVVIGSPADKAGLERYDVIVQVDGKPVDLGTLTGVIQNRKAGEKIAFEVFQKGKKHAVQIVLSKPVPLADAKLKYEEEPQTIWQDRMRWQGNLLRWGPDEWRMFGGGMPLADLDLLLKAIREYGGWQMEMEVDAAGNGVASWTLKRTRDGKTVQIRLHQDGRITVTRSQADRDGPDAKVSKTCKDAQDLRKADPDAYDMYVGMGGAGLRVWLVPGFGMDSKAYEQIRKQTEEMLKEAEERRKVLEKGLEKQMKDAEQRRKEVEAQTRKLQQDTDEAMKKMSVRIWSPQEIEKMMGRMGRDWMRPGAPEREFKVGVDGQIEVRIREGDGELTMKFKDDKDLQAKRPKLHEEYQNLLKSTAPPPPAPAAKATPKS